MSEVDEMEMTYPTWQEYKVTVEHVVLPDSTYYVAHLDTDGGINLGKAEGRSVAEAVHDVFAQFVGDFTDD